MSNKKQLECRMATPEKLQDKIKAVYTIYSQCEKRGQCDKCFAEPAIEKKVFLKISAA